MGELRFGCCLGEWRLQGARAALAVPSQRVQQATRPAMDWGPSLEENRTGVYVASLAGSQSPKPLMVHMRKYGGITSYENTAIEVDREMEEDDEEESMI